MKVLFESQDLWDVVEHGIDEPTEPTVLTALETLQLKDLRKKDKRALFLIYQVVDENIFERISSSDTSKEAWDILHKSYRGEEKVKIVRLQKLRCEFDGLRMKETESIEDFYNRVIILINQMRLNVAILEDKRVVEKILRSLTKKFEYVVVAIEESKNLEDFSLENLLGTLQSHELRMKQTEPPILNTPFRLKIINPKTPTKARIKENHKYSAIIAISSVMSRKTAGK